MMASYSPMVAISFFFAQPELDVDFHARILLQDQQPFMGELFSNDYFHFHSL